MGRNDNKTETKIITKWIQTGTKLGPNWDQTGTKLGPNWYQTRNQTGAKLVPNWDRTGAQTGTKLGPNWDQTGNKLGPKLGQIGTQPSPAPVRHRGPKKCRNCVTVVKNSSGHHLPVPGGTRFWDRLGNSLKSPTRTLICTKC